jgi:hypothetical protein
MAHPRFNFNREFFDTLSALAMASATSKQHAHLASVEADLLHRLLQHLPAVAAGRDTLFFTTLEFNPFALRVSTTGQELAELALEALALRQALSEPREGSVGQMFRAALQECADVNNPHRLGPIRLAERLLAALHERFATSG